MFGHKYITFLLSARNSLNQVFYKQLQRRVGIDYRHIFPIYLDRIKDTEVDDIANILDSNKLLTEAVLNINGGIAGLKTFIKNDCKSSFSELLLKMFDSPDIKGRLNKLYSSVDKCGDEKLKEVVIFSLLKNISNYDISFLEILDLFKAIANDINSHCLQNKQSVKFSINSAFFIEMCYNKCKKIIKSNKKACT